MRKKSWCPCVFLSACVCFALTLASIILPQTSQAATYYVDIDGVGEDGIIGNSDDVFSDDANPGTAEQPWQTLNRAYASYSGEGSKVQEGDTVYFRNGDYGIFTETCSVLSQIRRRLNWITYEAAPGHSPTLSRITIINGYYPYVDDGESYLKLNGFNVLNGVSIQHTSYVQILDCNITSTPVAGVEGYYEPYFSGGSTAIAGRYDANHVTIENCDISHTTRGIRCGDDGGEYWTIKNNTIHRFGEDGIRPDGASHLVIEGNLIYDTHKGRTGFALTGTISGTFEVGETIIQAGTNAEGIVYVLRSATSLSVYTTSETLFDTAPEGGTVTGQSSGATLSNVSKCDYSHSDPIQVESGAVVNDIVIRGNTFIASASGMAYLSFYGNGTNVTIENNLCYGDAANAFHVGGVASGLKIYNNTFGSGLKLTTGYSASGSNQPSIIDELYNNIILSYSQSADVNETLYMQVASHGNNIFGNNPNGVGGPAYPLALDSSEKVVSDFDALFTDADNNDYTLATDSAAIDFGNPDYGPDIDLLGNPRDALPDAGCYEYGATSILFGDVNSDAEISAFDAALAAHIAVDLEHPDIKNRAAAEVSGDGEVTAYDAALIAQRAVGLIDRFPVEE